MPQSRPVAQAKELTKPLMSLQPKEILSVLSSGNSLTLLTVPFGHWSLSRDSSEWAQGQRTQRFLRQAWDLQWS